MNKRQRHKEERALAALVTLALHDQDMLTDKEMARYMKKPLRLSKDDEAALKRDRPGLVKSIASPTPLFDLVYGEFPENLDVQKARHELTSASDRRANKDSAT